MDQIPFIDRDDPTHTISREGVAWSRVNEKGTMPGVSTPLSWSIWGEIGERAVRRGNWRLGVLSRAECEPAVRVGDRIWSIFYGRPAANVDTWRWLSARTPGRSAAGSEHTNFGTTRASETPEVAARRRLASAVRIPVAALALPARMRALRRRSLQDWRDSLEIAATGEPEVVARRLQELLVRFEAADVMHITASMLANMLNDVVAGLATEARAPELQAELLAGLPNLEEHETAVMLWRVSRGELELEAFLAEHGFRGPAEGEVSSLSWREDPTPLRALLQRLRDLPDTRDPRRGEDERARRGQRAQRALLAALPRPARLRARVVVHALRRLFPWREVGKAALILHLDALRACARRLGEELARAGRLERADDVFFLLSDEIALRGPDLRARVARRRARHREFSAIELPDAWVGMPETWSADRVVPEADEDGEVVLSGLAIGGGCAEGRVVVIRDPRRLAETFGEGDVLVADSTDPSWAPFFMVAVAVVMDGGSAISHAAIVAREMGIPAVVATGDATRRLRNGWRVRVDGDAGVVRVVARP